MPVGSSGRVVIEVEPELKRHMYSALAIKNLTLKEWFVGAAQEYVRAHELVSARASNQKTKARKS